MHSHKTLRQIIICLRGQFNLELITKRTKKFLLKKGEGILVEPKTWNIMKGFKKGSLMLVLCSEVYDESDYVRDFREFKRDR